MRLIDYLDKGASLGPDKPCLTMDGRDLSYGEVQRLSHRFARSSSAQPASLPAIRSPSCPATIRSPSLACSASLARLPFGVRSIRATKRPRTSSSSTDSIAACCSFSPPSLRWSTKSAKACRN